MPARSQFAAAIAQAEGFNVAGSLPQRNNNPGDLRGWPGVPSDASGYSVFPSAQAGWDALEAQLNRIRSGVDRYYSPSMTFAQMGAIYAGGDSSWAENVTAYLGTTPNAMIGSFLGLQPAAVPADSIVSEAPYVLAPNVTAPNALSPAPAVPVPENLRTLVFIVGGAVAVYFLARDLL